MRCLPKYIAAAVVSAGVLATGLLHAQSDIVSRPQLTVTDVLGSLSARADFAFAGQVVQVRPLAGSVEVEFRVDLPLKGLLGSTYVLREWSGLWAAGQRRYWVAERAVVFLHASPGGGFGSSVDGMEGVLPLTQVDAASPVTVDVTRLRAAALRDPGQPMVDAPPQMALTDLSAIVKKAAGAPPEIVPVHGTPVLAPPAAVPSAPPVLQAPDDPLRLQPARNRLPQPITGMPKVPHGTL